MPEAIRAQRGTALRCTSWRHETLLRLLENNLELAERPEDLVVYAAHGKAARNWDAYTAIVDSLKHIVDGQTLVIQSGKPVAVFPTAPDGPVVLMANGNLVGAFSTPHEFYRLESMGLIMWGGLTAGAWQYIGSQGVLQGTYETFAAVAREHFAGGLRGRLVATAGLGGMGSAQGLAVATMLGGVLLCAEVDTAKLEARRRRGYVDEATADLDAAIDRAVAAAAAGEPLSVGVNANAVDLLERLLERRIVPDVVTDLTAAHDLRYGYVPRGLTTEQAGAMRARDPEGLEERGKVAMVQHVKAMLALRELGAVVFDYGNDIRPHAASAGLPEAMGMDIFTARYLRPLFARGIGPFRWICVSGDVEDQAVCDELCLELFAGEERVTDWIELARKHVPVEGLPSRIAWLGHGQRTRLALAVNAAVADGRLRAPVAFTRDHMDSGAMTHPFIISEGMRDGSDAIADWPLLNALLAAGAQADLVAIHSGGGGYTGHSMSAGVTIIADGSSAAGRRLQLGLTVDTGLGVVRHREAGYEEAAEAAREHGLGLLSDHQRKDAG